MFAQFRKCLSQVNNIRIIVSADAEKVSHTVLTPVTYYIIENKQWITFCFMRIRNVFCWLKSVIANTLKTHVLIFFEDIYIYLVPKFSNRHINSNLSPFLDSIKLSNQFVLPQLLGAAIMHLKVFGKSILWRFSLGLLVEENSSIFLTGISSACLTKRIMNHTNVKFSIN